MSNIVAGSTAAHSATFHQNRGSDFEFYASENQCNNSYVFLHQNHRTGELDVVSQQPEPKFIISDIQLSTSGIYCIYKCAPEHDRQQCCIRIG